MPGSHPGALHCALHGGDAWDGALALHRRGPTAGPRPGASELIVRRQLGPGAVSQESTGNRANHGPAKQRHVFLATYYRSTWLFGLFSYAVPTY